MSADRKVVLVTGCSDGGIGSALCAEYAAQGCKVYATARKMEAMDGLKHGTNVAKLVLDVTKEKNVRDVVDTIISKEGQIDVLVNNAGVLCVGPVTDVPLSVVKDAYDANVFSVINMCQAVIPHMAERKRGTIVQISSIGAYIPTPWAGIYGSTKAALRSISDVLYMECTPLNVSVLTVTTGAVRSNLSKNQAASLPVDNLPEDSLSKRFLPDILARIYMSQGADSMPAEEYARRVVGASLQAKPPREMMIGGKTLLYRVLEWIPRTITLRLFWRYFTQKTREEEELRQA
ncbi:oxidoreductase [Lentinus tigrinus ALCF2SS1-7]|uniref:Oxidoreductase n=1 Tax=Lentinus tigrinus ALCF2SS1-6 TaxID=1328759 RepID=A0A5C2RUZ8_9APHY|nr:oxidoreductase [Lentinus tigrinus ALCF2SS1-6]RPD69634.1 oxidoreductase [Lentinus tigrinus ALCF2SS1-7]